MSADVSAFDFDGTELRTVVQNGEPWFVATDVARILGYRDAFNLLRRLDDDEKGTHSASTPGGSQMLGIISEAGLYVAIFGSQVAQATHFKRWVTHEVLPAIRRTGSYVPDITTPEGVLALAQTLTRTAEELVAARNTVAVLEPRAEAWDELASADGDYAVRDAAAILVRAGIKTGPQRLFDTLGEIGWTFRGEGRRWRPYAKTLDAGYMAERAMPPRYDHDGIMQPVPPQVRITARGLERLRVRLGVLSAVEVAS